MDYTNHPENLEKIKKSVVVFETLKTTTEELHKKVVNSGWAQRNALISHVYSDKQRHEELIAAKIKWEKLVFEHRVHKKLLEFVGEYKDIYGYFPNYKKFILDFDSLINTSVVKEEFEISAILKKWRDQFPNP